MPVTDTTTLRRATAHLLGIVALAVLFPLSAQAQSRPAIAVSPFVSKTVVYEDLCPEVSVLIAERLSVEFVVDVVVGDRERAEPQISVTGRIFTLESKPALMARITHVDSRRAFGAIVSSRVGETFVEMAQRLAERIGATITARPDFLSVARSNVGHSKPSAADRVPEPDPHPMRETRSAPRVRTIVTPRIVAPTAMPWCGLPNQLIASMRRSCLLEHNPKAVDVKVAASWLPTFQ